MTILNRQVIFSAILIYCSSISYGQNFCDSSKLLGNWTWVAGFPVYEVPNLDSLAKVIDSLKSTSVVSTYTASGTYSFTNGKKTSKLYYSIDSKKCTLKLRRREKSKKAFELEILLINEKHLILRQPNPHTYSIHLYRRI